MEWRSWSSLSCFIARLYRWISFRDRLCNIKIKRISLYYGRRIFWFSYENFIQKIDWILSKTINFLRNTRRNWCNSFQNQKINWNLIISWIFFWCKYYKIKLVETSSCYLTGKINITWRSSRSWKDKSYWEFIKSYWEKIIKSKFIRANRYDGPSRFWISNINFKLLKRFFWWCSRNQIQVVWWHFAESN